MNPKRVRADAPDPGSASGIFQSFLTRGAPALVRLRHALADFDADDRIDDPFLDGLIAELGGGAPGGIDPSLAHARAWLLRTRSFPGRSSARAVDWRQAVASLVQGPAPLASLWIDAGEHTLLTSAQRRRLVTHDRDDLALVPPCAPLIVDRHETLHLMGEELLAGGDEEPEPKPGPHDIARWEDDFARWSSRARQRAARAADWTTSLAGRIDERIALWPDETPWATSWRDLDRLLGGVWLALRRATVAREVVELASAEWLVPVGAGVCLSLDVRYHRRRDGTRDVRAAFATSLGLGGAFTPPTKHTTATGALGDPGDPGWELPTALYVTGANAALTARFTFMPWLAEGTGPQPM